MYVLPDPTYRRSRRLRWAGGIAALTAMAVIAGAGFAPPGQVGAQEPEPTASPTPTESPSPLPTETPSPNPDPLPAPPPEPAPEPEPAAPPPPAHPPLPANSGSGRRIVYSNSGQRVWLVEAEGEVAGSWLVSGRRGVPRPGTYRVFSKSRHTTALRGKVRMEFMVRFARGRSLAIGFHSIPVNRRTGRPIQTEGELGRYRSLGCVRQRYADAARMWEWSPIGTTVVVTR